MEIAVIGAGLAGLTAAEALAREGHAVRVWEKSRGVGGRTATRRADDLRFDHGAALLHDGARPLHDVPALATCTLTLPGGTVTTEAVASPTGNALAKAIGAGLDVRTASRVAQLARAAAGGWHLHGDDGAELDRADAVVVAIPAPQAVDLFRLAAPELAAQAASVPFAACWSVMAAWNAPIGAPWALVRDVAGLALGIRESAKPGRAAAEAWVLQADPDLTEAHLEAAPERVIELVLGRFEALIGRALPAPEHAAAHRWRYARPLAPLAVSCLAIDRLVVAGDWCGGSTAGAALRSGQAAASVLSGQLAGLA